MDVSTNSIRLELLWRDFRSGTFPTYQLHRAMPTFEGDPEDICSSRVRLNLTLSGRWLTMAERLSWG
jgi:hypothetical protein